VKFLLTYSTYQLDRVRPIGRTESSRQVFRTAFGMVTETFWAIGSLFKGGYIGLGQVVAEIHDREVGRDGLQVTQPYGHMRSGRYS